MPRKTPNDKRGGNEGDGENPPPGGRQSDLNQLTEEEDEGGLESNPNGREGTVEETPAELGADTERALEVIDDMADTARTPTPPVADGGVDDPVALAEQFNPEVTGDTLNDMLGVDDMPIEDLIESLETQLENKVLPNMRSETAAEWLVEGCSGISDTSTLRPSASPTDYGTYELSMTRGPSERTVQHEFAHGLITAHWFEYADAPREPHEHTGPIPDETPEDVSHRWPNREEPNVIQFDWSIDGNHKAGERFMLGGGLNDRQGRTEVTGLSAWRADLREEFGSAAVWRVLYGEIDTRQPEPADNVDDLRGLDVGVKLQLEDEGGASRWYVINGVVNDGVAEGDGTSGEADDTPHYEIRSETEGPGGRRSDDIVRSDPIDFRPTQQDDGVVRGDGVRRLTPISVARPSGAATEPPTEDGHPLSNAAGFEVPDGPDDNRTKVRNLSSAANKAWLRQVVSQTAVRIEAGDNDAVSQLDSELVYGNTEPYYINSTYSSCNAHETVAETVETIRGCEQYKSVHDTPTRAAQRLADNHPELVAAALDLYDPNKEAAEGIRQSENAERWNLTNRL